MFFFNFPQKNDPHYPPLPYTICIAYILFPSSINSTPPESHPFLTQIPSFFNTSYNLTAQILHFCIVQNKICLYASKMMICYLKKKLISSKIIPRHLKIKLL